MSAAKNLLLTVCWERMLVLGSLQQVTNPRTDEFTARPEPLGQGEGQVAELCQAWREEMAASIGM